MSYQVFARKYRPQTFDEVVGQQHITQTLKNAIEQNRLAHAYLFVGPRGTGKTSTARILAKALNCEKGPTVTPCGVCTQCREIAEGRSMNVLEFDAASNTQVDKVREIIIENVKYAPASGRYKLYIVDEVHMLSNSSFNALLKTLEEPPSHVIFIFATTDPQKVPLTIVSRCQRFDLRRIPAPQIAAHLQFIAKNETIKLDDAAAQAIARGAEGGLRDAESMLDQLVAFCGEKISEQDVLNIFGFTGAETVATLCSFMLHGKCADALGVVHEQAQKGKDLSRLMCDVITYLRDLLVLQADPACLKSDVTEEELAALQAHAEALSTERLLELIEQFAAAENRMKWAPNKKLHFEIAIIKAVQTLGQTTLNEVLETLSAIRGGKELPKSGSQKGKSAGAGASGSRVAPVVPKVAAPVARIEPVAAVAQETPAPAPVEASSAAAVAPPADISEIWVSLLTNVRKQRPLIRTWIESGTLVNIDASVAVIGFPVEQKLASDSLMRTNNRGFIEEQLAAICGRKIELRCETREGLVVTAVALPEPEPEPAPPDPVEEFKNDPLIRRALEIFRAEIQPA